MRFLAVLTGTLAFLCMMLGVVTLFEFLPPLSEKLAWYVWCAFSALLFLASITCKPSGHGGGEY